MARFTKGVSGNPKGRPARKDTEQATREAIRQALPGVVERLIAQALDGDIGAAKLLLERSLPSWKPTDRPASLALRTADLGESGAAVLAAMGNGSLTPTEAGAMAGVLTSLVRIEEATTLADRITRLEQRIQNTR